MLVSLVPGRATLPGGFRSGSPSMLFSWMPVPGTMNPDPQPVVAESDAAFPFPSTALMWVVEGTPAGSLYGIPPRFPGGRGRLLNPCVRQEPAGGAPAVEIADEPGAAEPRRFPHGLGDEHDPLGAPRGGHGPQAVEHPEREGDQKPARGRRRVGHELRAPVDRPHRAASNHAVVVEIGLGDGASPLPHRRARARG